MYRIYTKQFGALKKHARKFLFLMRLTTAILIISMLQVSAATLAQKLTYAQQNATLTQLFKVIKSQTGYNVVWYEGDLDASRTTVNANFKKTPIDEVMQQILHGLPLTYEISKQTIIIKAKPVSSSSPPGGILNKIDVHGIVTDEKGNPLPGATIRVKGTDVAAVTNANGEFEVKEIDENATLSIYYVGYEPKEIIAVANVGKIALAIATSKLDEVKINAGYYTVTDRERTGDISKVNAATIAEQPVDNPLMALEGRVPGVQITQLTGVPGGGFTVQIRGRNSISSGNDPLYIIDGVTFPATRIQGVPSSILSPASNAGASPLSSINPNDIESIEVLKDADATAIYGSRGANGVILITTKKGVSGDTKVSAGISRGFSRVAHHVDLLNTEQYIAMRKEALKNDGLQPSATDYDINGTWDQSKYTDWQKELIGGTAHTTNASLDVSGGTAKSNFLISGNYYKTGTVFPGDFGLQRASFRSSVNIGSPDDRFKASFTANYSHTQSNLFSTDITSYILLAPNSPDLYDQYGKLNWSNNTVTDNPAAYLLQKNNASTDNLIGDLTLSYEILKNLTFKTSLGYTTIKRSELQETPLASYSPSFGLTAANRMSYFGNNYNNNLIAEPQLNFKSKIGPGNLDALVGLSLQSNNAQINVINASNYTSDNLMENIGSAALLQNYLNTYSQYHYLALYSRLNYNLQNKYFINLTARRDGSSRFGQDRQYANFGAVGGAWVFSDERGIKDALPFLSFGKLRASYGVTGNDQIANYGYLQLWNTNATYQGNATITPSTAAPNADFGWETNRKFEVATQIGLFNDKLNIEISYYRNRSSNQLLAMSLPLSTGLGGLTANLPGEVQNTGWEFTTDFKILKTENWLWSTGFNLTIPRNKLLSYPGLESSSDAINYQVGQPLSILKVYNVSVNPQTGLYVFEDKNGNGTRDNADRYVTKFLGQYYYGGLQNSIKYKQLSFNIYLSFAKQNGRSYQTTEAQTPGKALSFSSNQYSAVLGRWQQPGDATDIQKFTTISANNTLNTNAKSLGDLSIVDASYIRIRNVALTYAIPKSWLSVLKIKNGTISIQGENIFTFTRYIGLDPETQSLNVPPLRTFTMGLNLTF